MVRLDFSLIERTDIIGYSPLEPKDLAAKIAAGCKPSQLPGDFVLIIEGKRGDLLPYVALITSAVCAIPYYIYQLNNRFVHGQNVFEVVELAKIAWKWNNDALNAIALLGFCLGNDSLHQDVKRAYPACIYYYCQEQLNIIKDTFPTDVFSGDRIGLDDALGEYNRVCDQYYSGREVCLSLSAGYDSRVLLASLLKRGIKPIIGTEGGPDSEDVKIASAIAKDLALEHRIIELTENDFVKSADGIIETTSGELFFNGAWGSSLFLQQVQFPQNMLHLAGSNGGLFKSFYFNMGILSQIADRFPKLLLKQYFDIYLIYRQRQYKNSTQAFLWNKQSLKPQQASDRCYELSAINDCQFCDRLDHFFTYYRVANYTAQGVALYNLLNLTISPFLDYRVVIAGARLNRKYKLNKFFHQQILLDSYPQLTNYPVNGSSISTMSAEQNFYWLKKKSKNKSTGKSLTTRLMENSELKDICYNSPYLDNFLDRKQRIMAVENRVFAIFSFLVTMHFVSQKIESIK